MIQVTYRRCCFAFVLIALALMLGCQPSGDSNATADAVAESPGGTPSAGSSEANAAQRKTAQAAAKALFTQLSDRLMEVLSEEDAPAAIKVCSEEAPQISQDVGQQHGVSIGRTSFRVRNQQNTPPEWAESYVEKRVEEPQFVDLEDGRLGALLPIHLKPQCVVCHGPKENIPAGVRQALAENYPQDQATGFQVGDLRGWFWVEVPPQESSAG